MDLLCLRLLVSKTTGGIGRRRRRTVYVVVAGFKAVVAIVVVIVVFSMSNKIWDRRIENQDGLLQAMTENYF